MKNELLKLINKAGKMGFIYILNKVKDHFVFYPKQCRKAVSKQQRSGGNTTSQRKHLQRVHDGATSEKY